VAVAYDAVTGDTFGSSQMTVNHTGGVGANCVVTFVMQAEQQVITSITWNGSDMTELGYSTASSHAGTVSAWYDVGECSGAHDCIVEMDGTINTSVIVTSFLGVNQGDPIVDHGGTDAVSTTIGWSVDVVTDGWVVDGIADQDENNDTAEGEQTQLGTWNPGFIQACVSHKQVTDTDPETMTWYSDTNLNDYIGKVLYVVSLNPEAGALSWGPSWTQTADGEEGDESDWDAVGEVGTGTLDVSSDAPKSGTYGWAVTINGAANYAYADLTGPAADTVHSLRLQFDPNGITMGSDEAFVLAQGFSDSNDWIWFAELYRYDSKYHVRMVILDDDGGTHYGNSVELSDAYHQITISWKQSDGSNNGFIRLFVDTDYKDVVSGIDNDTHNINIARTGAGYGVDAGTAGTFYLDDVQWCAN
jgi:hypothetical protein